MKPSFLIFLPLCAAIVPFPRSESAPQGTSSTDTVANNVTVTFWGPGGETGSCGKVIEPSDLAISVPVVQYAGGANCFTKIGITYKDKFIQVPVVNLCQACDSNSIDLSEEAFRLLSPLDAGLIHVTLNYSNVLATTTSTTATSTSTTTSASSLPAQTSPISDSVTGAKSNTPAIIGGTIGGVACILLVLCSLFFCRRHMRNGTRAPSWGDPATANNSSSSIPFKNVFRKSAPLVVPFNETQSEMRETESVQHQGQQETTLISPTSTHGKYRISLIWNSTPSNSLTQTNRSGTLKSNSTTAATTNASNGSTSAPGGSTRKEGRPILNVETGSSQAVANSSGARDTESMAAEIARLRAENNWLRDQQEADLALGLVGERPPSYS